MSSDALSFSKIGRKKILPFPRECQVAPTNLPNRVSYIVRSWALVKVRGSPLVDEPPIFNFPRESPTLTHLDPNEIQYFATGMLLNSYRLNYNLTAMFLICMVS